MANRIYPHASFRVALATSLLMTGVMLGSSQTLKIQPLSLDEPVIITTDLVSVKVSVTDSFGRAVSGLDENVFTIFDDKVPQTISFFSDEDGPASIAVVFDTSGSMNGDKIVRAKEALAHFIQTGHDRDEYFLIDFDSQARLLLDRTRDGDAIFRKLTYVQPHGKTALYDAVYLGIEKVMRGAHQKRAILLITDGEDNHSRYNFNELRRRLRESDATIYAIGVVENYLPRKGGPNGRETLEELASVSGGKAFFPGSASDMFEAFERIGLELRHLYSIGYRPSKLATNGNWHRLKIKVEPPPGFPRLFLRSREGYYALTNVR
jgi:Ca-activated chloride channel family protein